MEKFDPSQIGADEETIKKWKEAGLVNATRLPEGTALRRVTQAELDRLDAEGKLHSSSPFSEDFLLRLLADAEEEIRKQS
jgi:hypothetical protein